MRRQSRKLRFTPPTQAKLSLAYVVNDDPNLVTALGLVIDVAGTYRGHRSIWKHVERDLMRFSAIVGIRPGPVGLAGDRAPFLCFERGIAEAWLEAGGRAWIIAEMEARSTERVIPFPVLAS